MSNRRRTRRPSWPLQPPTGPPSEESVARFQRRHGRRIDAMGNVVVRPPGWGAKHSRRQAAQDARVAAQARIDEAAATAAAAVAGELQVADGLGEGAVEVPS